MSQPVRNRVRLFAVLACLTGLVPRIAAAEDFAFFHENVMGTSLELRVRADGEASAAWAEGRVLKEIDRLSALFSGYDPASEFSRWQATRGPVKLSPELFEVLQASDAWREQTGGTFDPRVQPLTQLWSACARADRLPTAEELAAARRLAIRPAWRLEPAGRTAERLSDGPLTLNAIAKGYIVEKACAAALDPDHGVRGLLLNVGGDLRACGQPARSIGIAAPRNGSESIEPIAAIEIRDRGVATSGRHLRGFRIGGKWYSHIFDPRTGRPAEGVAGATVIALRSADADALATALNVLPPEDGLRLVDSLEGFACLIVAADGRILKSQRWADYERPVAAPGRELAAAQEAPKGKNEPAQNGAAQAFWGDTHELAVNLEINQPGGNPGRYRRPYVAVWVEDREGRQIRTIALWVSLGGSGPSRWLPDLKRWYRSDEARKRLDSTEMVLAIAQPTRPPGQYSVIWDGKDNFGKPVEPGNYTLFIDAAREHGTYQSLRKAITVGGKPFSEDLKGNVEIKSASVEYRRKAPAK